MTSVLGLELPSSFDLECVPLRQEWLRRSSDRLKRWRMETSLASRQRLPPAVIGRLLRSRVRTKSSGDAGAYWSCSARLSRRQRSQLPLTWCLGGPPPSFPPRRRAWDVRLDWQLEDNFWAAVQGALGSGGMLKRPEFGCLWAGFTSCSGCVPSTAPVGPAVGREDVWMVAEAVEQSGGQFLVAEAPDLLGDFKVGGDYRGAALRAVRQHLGELFATGPFVGHEAWFDDDQQGVADVALVQACECALVVRLEWFASATSYCDDARNAG